VPCAARFVAYSAAPFPAVPMRLASLVLVLLLAAPAFAQDRPPPVRNAPDVLPVDPNGPRRQTGPRFGFTYLAPGVVDRINERVGDADNPEPFETPITTQFGWQFEVPTFRSESGLTGVLEIVPLVGGLERSLILPTVTLIAGARTPDGWEFGVGPNVTLADVGPVDGQGTGIPVSLAFVGGKSLDIGGANVPINTAIVVGESGARVSLLIGLTTSSGRY